MNEDLKPCYDIASDWVLATTGYSGRQISRHKDYSELYRIVDFTNKTITFKDANRILPNKIVDIYRPLSVVEKFSLVPILLQVITEEKPISMPYIHEEIPMYVQFDGENLGILYYKDSDEEKSIMPIKRFFKGGKERRWAEVTFTEFSREFNYPYESDDDKTTGDAGEESTSGVPSGQSEDNNG